MFVDYYFTRHLITECEHSFMHPALSYVIAADIMERKTGENEFSRIIKSAFCSGGYAHDQIRQRVSLLAYGEILKHVAILLSNKVVDWILRTSFNEWGAILIQKEFMNFYTTFEEICEDRFRLTHSLTHSLTHLLTHSLTHSLTHTLTHSLTHSVTTTTMYEAS